MSLIKKRNRYDYAFWVYLENFCLKNAIEKEIESYYLKKQIVSLLGNEKAKKESEHVIIALVEVAVRLKKIEELQGTVFYKDEKERCFKNITNRFCFSSNITSIHILINMHTIGYDGIKKYLKKKFKEYYPSL